MILHFDIKRSDDHWILTLAGQKGPLAAGTKAEVLAYFCENLAKKANTGLIYIHHENGEKEVKAGFEYCMPPESFTSEKGGTA